MAGSSEIDGNLLRQACSTCYLSRLCLPVGLNDSDLGRLDRIISKRHVIGRGESVFMQEAPFTKLIAIRSGSFKTYKIAQNGNQQVVGFFLPGELLGFDGIHAGKYGVSSVALEVSSVCEVPFNQLLALAAELPSLQQQLVRIMSEKLDTGFAISINSSAEQRLATFLLSISNRYKHCGYSGIAFKLSMSREDIGNYLGLATETVSRLMTTLQHAQIIKVLRKQIEIYDFRQLQHLACGRTSSK